MTAPPRPTAAGRNPEPYMEKMKKAGMVVTHKCTSVRHSIKAEKIGCDAVSIDGFEAADMEAGVMAAGQIVGLIRDIPSVQELMDRIIREALEALEHCGKFA